MARVARSVFPDEGFFHVTTRGVDRCAISRDVEDRTIWLWLRKRAIERFDLNCHAFCLMPNHFHLVVEGRREDLSRAMHRLNGAYAQLFNEKYGRSGHLFQNRFGLRLIESESYLAGACEYVRANPVRAGLCASPDDWPWSGILQSAPVRARTQSR